MTTSRTGPSWLGNRCVELERNRLLEQILPEFAPGTLLLLNAGPGTGKTFLIHQLLKHDKKNSVYIDLNKLSPDTTAFVQQIEHLFTTLWPAAFGDLITKKTNQPAKQCSPADRVDFLLDQICISGDETACIAFDGCELLGNRPSWVELIALILRRFPSFVSIILASKNPLKFPPLPALRLQGKLLEITTDNLHFNDHEIKQFLTTNIPGIKKGTLKQIQQQVGGWPAGLSLLCLEYKKKGTIVALNNTSPENLQDYLHHEVFADLPDPTLQILCTAALLQPFDYELLKTFLSVTIQELEELFSSLSFLLDSVKDDNIQPGFKRLSHLYTIFFHSRATDILGHKEKTQLHKRAARFFQKSDLVDRALPHLIALEDWPAAVKLILAGHKNWFTEEEYERLLFWVNQLPESCLTQQPRLALLQGRAHLYLGNLDEAINVLTFAHKHTRSKSRDWLESGCRLCEVLLLKGCLRDGVDLAEKLALHSSFISRHRAEAMMFQAIGLGLLNRPEKCKQLWKHISTIASSKFLPLSKTARCYLMAPKAIFYNLDRGDFEDSEYILDMAITVFRNSDPRKRLGWTLLFKGVLKLELHQYSEAVTWFREAVVVSEAINRSVHAGCTAFLSLTLAIEGQIKEARQWHERAEPLASKDLTLWAPILCGLTRVYLAKTSGEAEQELKLSWNLANQRSMMLPIALTAYTAFAVQNKTHQAEITEDFCCKAIKTCRKRKIHHREAQILLYLYLLQKKTEKTELTEHFTRAMTLISENNLGFLLTDDRRIDGLKLTLQAIEQDISRDYFLNLSRAWKRKALSMLQPLFRKANLTLKVKIAATWARDGYKPAIPLLEESVQSIKRKKTALKLIQMIEQLKESPPVPLHIQLFGPFTLAKGEELVPKEAWKRLKAKELFKMLCLYPDTTFTLDQLTEIFWPESSPDKSRANLWSAMSAIRSAIEPELSARAKSSYLLVNSQTYKLQLPGGSTIDTILFEQNAHQGIHFKKHRDNARALLYFELALNQFSDEILPEELYAPWAEEQRERLGLLFSQVLESMAEIFLDQRDHGQCIRIYRKLIAHDKWNEDAYLALMQCYLMQGQDLEAIKVYRRCEDILQKELEIMPNQQLQELLKRIIKRRSPATMTEPLNLNDSRVS